MKFSNMINTIGLSYNFQWIYLNCMTTIKVHFMLNHSGFFFDIVHLQLEKKSFHFINFKQNESVQERKRQYGVHRCTS